MEKLFIIANNPLLIQILENNESKLLFDSIQYVFVFICIITALLVMMLIPAILGYSMIDSFFNIYKHKKEIDTKICIAENNHHSEYSKCICDKYLKSYSSFTKSFAGLAAWNIFSLVYIIFGFESFRSGLIEYFYFPFNMLSSLTENEILNSISSYSTNWSYMLSIIVLTIVFTLIGKYIGVLFGKEKINQRGLSLSVS